MPFRMTDTIKKMLIAFVSIFVLQQIVDGFLGGNLLSWFALIPLEVIRGRIWQVITYPFMHSGPMDLVLNMLILVFVGAEIESTWGRRKFLGFFFFCTTLAGLVYLLIQLALATSSPAFSMIPMVGTSGGMYGLLVAYAVMYSDREMLFMMMFPMKAKHFIMVLAGIEFLQALSMAAHPGEKIAAFAHLSGMGAGLLFLWLQAKGIQVRRGNPAPTKKKSSHLRLIKNEAKSDDDEPTTWH